MLGRLDAKKVPESIRLLEGLHLPTLLPAEAVAEIQRNVGLTLPNMSPGHYVQRMPASSLAERRHDVLGFQAASGLWFRLHSALGRRGLF